MQFLNLNLMKGSVLAVSQGLLITTWVMILFGVIYTSTMVHAVQVDRYWSVLEVNHQKAPESHANGFIGIKFREDFKQLVYNINVNNIDNITGIFLYSRGDNMKNTTMILDLLEEAKEVKVKDKFREASMMLSKTREIEGTVAVGGVTAHDLQGELRGKSLKSLHQLVENEDVYVIVVTKEFPQGELYGYEFIPIERFFPDMSDFQWN
jgi:hypothetical protein